MDKKPFPIQRVFLNSISLNKFGYNTQKEKKHIKNLSYSNGYFPYLLKSPEREEHDRKTLFESFQVNKFLNKNINQKLKTPILPETTRTDLLKNSLLNTFGNFIIITKEEEYKKGIPILTLKQEEFENKISLKPKYNQIKKKCNILQRDQKLKEIITNKEILSHLNHNSSNVNSFRKENENNMNNNINVCLNLSKKKKYKIISRNFSDEPKLFINKTEVNPKKLPDRLNKMLTLFEMKDYYNSLKFKPFKFK